MKVLRIPSAVYRVDEREYSGYFGNLGRIIVLRMPVAIMLGPFLIDNDVQFDKT